MWCAFLQPIRASSSMASDRVPIPPDRWSFLPCPGGLPVGGAPDRTWVVSCRAVVKIYHGRNVDRLGLM
ncbi:hypothetical protein C4B68_25105 [Streptomyces dengpaensis]|uniref:Secreted protein n=1 Tax=Streptomyces dengpaensis TaxID=2049881 RepID=A0ABM6SUS1_9ACTN|nr:hypothetical protein C4B68_25105 [Streptomyces dengpaensis]